MDRDLGKRRAPHDHPEDFRDPKMRRTNSQEQSNEKNGNSNTMNSNKRIGNLVSFWTAGGNIHPLVAQEGTDATQLKEAEEKCFEAEKIVNDMRKKLVTSERNVANLNIALKQEGIEKQSLVSKMNSTWELIRTITQHVTYATDTLGDCQKHMTYLNSTYNDVILKLRGDNEELNQRLDSIALERNANAEEALQQLSVTEAELKNTKSKCDVLESQIIREKELALDSMEDLNKSKRKLADLEISEKKNQMIIVELENKVISQMAIIENHSVMEQDKLDQTCQGYENELSKLRNELAEANAQRKHIELERDEVFRTLASKEREIETLEKKAESYSKQMQDLQDMMNNTSDNVKRFNDEKIQWEKQLQDKNHEVVKVLQDLNSVSLEKEKLETQVTILNEKLTSERKEKFDLQHTLSQNLTFAQESSKRVEELNESLEKDRRDKQKVENILAEKDSQIEDLMQKIQRLENEHKNEMKNQTEKYEKCLFDLNKMSSTLENTTKLDTSSREEYERLRNEYFEEKQEKEKIQEKLRRCEDMLAKKNNADTKKKAAEKKQKEQAQEKLKKCEEMLAKKMTDEAQLLEKFNKLQADYTETKRVQEDVIKKRAGGVEAINRKISNLYDVITTPLPVLNIKSMKKNYLQGITVTANQNVSNGSQELNTQNSIPSTPSRTVSKKSLASGIENLVPSTLSHTSSVIESKPVVSNTQSRTQRSRTRSGLSTPTRLSSTPSRVSQISKAKPNIMIRKVEIPPASVTKPILKSVQKYKDSPNKFSFEFDADLEFEKPDALVSDVQFDELINSPKISQSRMKSYTPLSISQQTPAITPAKKFFKSRQSQSNEPTDMQNS